MKKKKKLTIADIKRNNNTTVPSVISRIKAKEIELTVFFVIIILGFIVTISYMVSSSIRDKKTYNTLKTGSIEVVFNETNTSMGDVINIVDQKPIIDKKSKKLTPYTFTIKNTSNKKKEYKISIVEDQNMIDADNCSDKLYDKKYLKYSIDNKKIGKLKSDSNEIVVYHEKLNKKEEKIHKLRVWVSSDVDDIKKVDNKHFHAKIIITSEDAKKEEVTP